MRRSKRSLEGELLIDHSASPGLDADIAAWVGVSPRAVAKGQTFECAIYVCAHCQTQIVKNPERVRPRGYCRPCDKYICDECEGIMGKTLACHSAQRQIETFVNTVDRFGSASPLLLRQGD